MLSEQARDAMRDLAAALAELRGLLSLVPVEKLQRAQEVAARA